jgi:hypothetical protein
MSEPTLYMGSIFLAIAVERANQDIVGQLTRMRITAVDSSFCRQLI